MSILRDVTLNDGSECPVGTVAAFQPVPGFAIFYDHFGGWNLTHVKTGLRVIPKGQGRPCCVLRCIAIAETVASLIDWDLPEAELAKAGKAIDISAIIRAVKCPNHCGDGE